MRLLGTVVEIGLLSVGGGVAGQRFGKVVKVLVLGLRLCGWCMLWRGSGWVHVAGGCVVSWGMCWCSVFWG